MKLSPAFALSLIVASLVASDDVAVSRRPRDGGAAPCNASDSRCVDPCYVPLEKCPPECMITPPRAPRVACAANVTAEASFIYWKATLAQLSYAASGVTSNTAYTPANTNAAKGTVKTPDFSFHPGFKLGFGGDLPHDGWDLWANYTWLAGEGQSTNSISASRGKGLTMLIPITLNDGTVNTYGLTGANSAFKQDLNMIDLELGRSFFVSPSLMLRPQVGVKTAWIQDYVRYNYNFVAGVTAFDTTTVARASAIYSQHMWGLGIRTGLDGDWKITPNWGFYGSFAASGVWTDFHIRTRQTTFASVVGQTTNYNTAQVITQITPVLETAFGLSYTGWSKSNQRRFVGRVGWEQQVWLGMNQITYPGNLSFQGLTIDFAVSF
jgi:hypothetical protein